MNFFPLALTQGTSYLESKGLVKIQSNSVIPVEQNKF